MAMARSPEPPRAETTRTLPVPILLQTKRSLHQPVPLQKSRKSCPTTGTRTQAQRLRTRTFPTTVSTTSRTQHAAQRQLHHQRIQFQPSESQLAAVERFESRERNQQSPIAVR